MNPYARYGTFLSGLSAATVTPITSSSTALAPPPDPKDPAVIARFKQEMKDARWADIIGLKKAFEAKTDYTSTDNKRLSASFVASFGHLAGEELMRRYMIYGGGALVVGFIAWKYLKR